PFLGACYGIGTLGTHQGARIDRTHGEPLGAVEITLTEAGLKDPLVREARLPETFTGLVGHKEAVHTLPPHAVTLASGRTCPVQMFRVGTRQYATQFHPELDVPSIIERARAYREHGYFSPDEMEDVFDALRHETADEAPRLLRAFATLFARCARRRRVHARPRNPLLCRPVHRSPARHPTSEAPARVASGACPDSRQSR